MSKIKAGIIGCGGIGNGKHLPALAACKDRVEVVGFCDIIKERAEQACAQYGAEGAKVYTDYKEMLKDESIQTIHVCTPNRSHSFISIDAMEAGKHVICEKPMAKTYAEAKAMVECAKRTGQILTIGYQNRYRSDSMYLKTLCNAGELGEIYYAKGHAVRRRAVPTWGVFLDEYEQGGGPLIDIGTHALDLTLWYMDNYKPKLVVGSVARFMVQKNHTRMLEQFACLKKIYPNSHLLLAGEGELQAAMEEKAKRLGIYDSVSFLGVQKDTSIWYQAMDVFLMPSLFEPCGLSQLMSLRYGTLPIVRETGGLKDTVVPYNEYEGTGNGFSFRNYNAHEMLATVRNAERIYYDKKREWNKMVDRAMAADFSWGNSARQYEEMYNWLIGDK